MIFAPRFWTTHVGSVPYTDGAAISRWLAAGLDIPAWPQLPRRTFRENMYVQYSAALPRVVLDEANEKITVDTTGDLIPALERFYERYLADDVDAFALPAMYAEGFFAMLDILRAGPGDSFASLAKKYPLKNDGESLLRLINDKFPDGEPRAGELIKIIE